MKHKVGFDFKLAAGGRPSPHIQVIISTPDLEDVITPFWKSQSTVLMIFDVERNVVFKFQSSRMVEYFKRIGGDGAIPFAVAE
jgi:hypothetical protein